MKLEEFGELLDGTVSIPLLRQSVTGPHEIGHDPIQFLSSISVLVATSKNLSRRWRVSFSTSRIQALVICAFSPAAPRLLRIGGKRWRK